MINIGSSMFRKNRKHPALFEPVILNLANGSAFQGFLSDQRGEYLIMRDATFLEKDGQPVKMAGEVVIPNGPDIWVQKMGS